MVSVLETYVDEKECLMNDIPVCRVLASFGQDEKIRDEAWELLHKAFLDSRGVAISSLDKEKLGLHLTGYLANLGMYRASSFLMTQINYLVHCDLVDILMKGEYQPLFDIDPFDETARFVCLAENVYREIDTYYRRVRGTNRATSVTLVTKIMLGVYGCVPAYDEYVTRSLRKYGIPITKKGIPDFEALIKAIKKNNVFLENVKAAQKHYNGYTIMRLIDMILWKVGQKISKNKGGVLL